jgi:hypothetical protein
VPEVLSFRPVAVFTYFIDVFAQFSGRMKQ